MRSCTCADVIQPCCCNIGLLFGKRLDMILLCHRIRKYPDSPVHTLSDSLRICFFPLWRANLKISGFAVEFAAGMRVDGSRLRKEKVACTCGFKNIRIRVDGASVFSILLKYITSHTFISLTAAAAIYRTKCVDAGGLAA